MEQNEKKYFADDNSNGINADDAPEFLLPNQWVNLENFRSGSTDKGVTGVLESIGSNTQLTSLTFSNPIIHLCAVDDPENNRIIFFIYNTNLPEFNNAIYAYYRDTNTTYTVMFGSQVVSEDGSTLYGGLNFSKDHPIDAEIVGDLLYWTDNFSNPRRININAAIKLLYPAFVTDVAPYTSPIAYSVTTLIRYAPQRQPTLTFSTVGGRVNLLRSFSGQFAFRNVFRDGETSVFGTPSIMARYRYGNDPASATYDTSNRITVTLAWQNGFDIEQDVQIFELAVRYNNQPEYFVIKTWDKSNATDLAEIVAYNAGGSLTFDFYNDKTGIAVSTNDSTRPFHSVPNLSETVETGLSRLFLGRNTVGYDTPTVTSLTGTAIITGGLGLAFPILKSFSSYQLGIRFRDKYKRACGVVTDPVNCVVTVPDRGDWSVFYTTFYTHISATLSNVNALAEIPDWAYYYDILLTKNLRTRFFAQWAMRNTEIQYVKKNVDGTYTYQNNFENGLFGVAFKTSNLTLNGMGVVFTQGDFVRIYFNGLTPIPVSLAVVGQDADYIIVTPTDFGVTTAITNYTLIEYYTPYIQNGEEAFYTTGATNEIINPATALREYGNTTVNIAGDATFYSRVVNNPPLAGVWGYNAEVMSTNDSYWKDWFGLYGEQNFVTKLGKAIKDGSVKWSETIIQGSQTNGLSAFNSENEKQLPDSMGILRKLKQTSKVEEQGNIMLAICEQQTAALYLGEVQAVGADQNTVRYVTDEVIGTVNVLKGNYGTINPEGVVEFRGAVFFPDANNGKIVQYASNGLFPISDYKMVRFWNLWFRQYKSMTRAAIEALGGRPFIFMTVDSSHNELLISLPKLSNTPPKGYLPDYPSTIYPFDILDFQGKTIVYKLSANPNHWQGAFTFYAEGFVTMNNELFSLKNGQLWVHNQTTSFNNFYGVANKSRIMPVSNLAPIVPKPYNNVSVQSNLVPNFLYLYNDYPYQQSSDLVNDGISLEDFKDLEGVWYATFYRNKIQPNGGGGFTYTSLLTGEKMRGTTMFILIEFDVNLEAVELKYMSIGFAISRGHQNWLTK